jgi:ankyrin repeat protein
MDSIPSPSSLPLRSLSTINRTNINAHHPPSTSSPNSIMPPTLAKIAPELLLDIAEYLPFPDLQAFVRCNSYLYHLLLRSLYKRAVAGVPCGPCMPCGNCYSLRPGPTCRFPPWLGNARQVALSLAAGFDVNAIVACQAGPTRLHLAVLVWCGTRWAKEEEEVIRLLLLHGADVNAQDHGGLTPLHQLSWGPMPRAVADGRMPNPVLDILLRNGANVNAVTNDGQTPLHLAMGPFANYGMIAVLLGRRGIDPNMVDNLGQTPLHYALTRSGHVGVYRVVELLLHCGADPNMFDAMGRRPLYYAMRYFDDLGVMQLLLEYGADPDIVDITGVPALCWALRPLDNPVLVELLLGYGANPNIIDSQGRSVLYYTRNHCRSRRVMELFLRHGADPNAILRCGIPY